MQAGRGDESKYHCLVLTIICTIATFQMWTGTRLAATLRGDESEEKLDMLKDLDLIMLLLYVPEGDEKSSRVHASRR